MKNPCVLCFLLFSALYAGAEMRSAQDIAKECRIALDVVNNRIEKSSENTLVTGDCIGYIQAATDASVAMTDDAGWFAVCLPQNVSTLTLIQKFTAFADGNPKYDLAMTAFQMMLRQEYACPQ